jgi:hypothetical protein
VDKKNPSVKSDEISVIIKELLKKSNEIGHFLSSKWKIIMLATLLGAITGLILSFIIRPKYTAVLSFAVANDKTSPLGAYAGLASMAGIDLGGGGSDLFSSDNIIELMKSRKMVESTLLAPVEVGEKKITLIEHYITFEKLRKRWGNKPKLTNIHYEINCDPSKFNRAQDSIIGQIYKTIKENNFSVSKPDKKLSIIESTITSKNEIFSKVFLEEINNKVSEFYIETKTKRLKQNVDILQDRADSLSAIITSSTLGIANLTDQNLNPSRAIVSAGKSRKQVDLQVAGAVYAEVVKNLELAKVTLQKETPLIQVIDSPIYPLKKERLGKLEGLIYGGIIACLLIMAWLLSRRFFQLMMND